MSKKILVVGGGGREHAIIKALKKSPDCGEVWCAPGNGGIGYDAHCVNIKATDVETMVGFAETEKFDYVVVAQDDPLALGMVDALAAGGTIIHPKQAGNGVTFALALRPFAPDWRWQDA